MKVKVSERALIQRINRKLKKEDGYQVLRKDRHGGINSLGYYILNTYNNFIDAHNIDLNQLAKELDVLSPYEELEA